jgi:hypothetical protein
MRKIFLPLLAVFLVGVVIHGKAPAIAATNNNNLVDDFTFDDTSTLSAAQIDAWLNSFSSSCISPDNGFTTADPSGYSPNSSFVDGHYTYGGAVTAGRAIHDVAVAHGINPQVLLTKLQNEEQLVDGSAGCDTWRYTSAVGYACTDGGTNTHNYTYTSGNDPYASGAASFYTLNDSTHLVTPIYYKNGVAQNSITGSCVNTNVFAGFSEQIAHAAWALSVWRHKSEGITSWAAFNGSWNHCEDNSTCDASLNIPDSWGCYAASFWSEGTFKRCPTDSTGTYFDGLATIDGTVIHLDNGATAALYDYTPHFQSFDTIFNRYFGSQYANDSFTPHPNGALVSMSNKVYLVDNNTLRWIPNPYVFYSYGYSWGQVKTATTGDKGLPTDANVPLAPGAIFYSGSSPVYVMTYDSNGNPAKQQISLSAFNSLGYKWSDVVSVPSSVVPSNTVSGILFASQHPPGTLVADKSTGKVYKIDYDSTGKQFTKNWVFGPYAFSTNFYQWGKIKNATSMDLALITGPKVNIRQGTMAYNSGNLYLIDYNSGNVMKRPVGPWECYANRWHYVLFDAYSIPLSSLPATTSSLATC